MANGVQILPTIDRFAGLRQGALNLVSGLQQQAQQRRQQAALQQVASPLGLNLPQGINPQLAAQMILNAQQAKLTPSEAQRPIPLGPDQELRHPVTGALIGQRAASKPVQKAGKLTVALEGDETGLPAGTVFQADPQGNIKIISEAGGVGLTGVQKVQMAADQGKEFRSDQRVKDFRTIASNERNINIAFNKAIDPKTKSKIAADQALIVAFNKMLDPGSVVRESEFARTPQGQGIISRIEGSIEQVSTGGVGLTDDNRRELRDLATQLLNGAKADFNQAFSEFSTRADEIGLNKRTIFGDAKPFDIGPTPIQGKIGTELIRPRSGAITPPHS